MFLSERSARAVGIIVTIVALALAGYAIIEGRQLKSLEGGNIRKASMDTSS